MLSGLAAIVGLFTILWLASLALKNASIVDMLMTRKKYLVITADIILPRHAGAGALYSREYKDAPSGYTGRRVDISAILRP